MAFISIQSIGLAFASTLGFDKKLEGEERWIRDGIKARCTRNESRVRGLMKG